MLKGHVFKEQIFGNQIFALFIDTFLNSKNGISNNYKNGMKVTYNDNTLTVQSGVVCIQGRFLEEDTSSDISAGTDSAYCKLVIEIDLDKQNTETQLNQAAYKIIKSSTDYPALTQTNTVKNNSGVYQYELARFKNTPAGITEFQDMRTFLDYKSIYTEISEEYHEVLAELQQELTDVQEDLTGVVENIIKTDENDTLKTIIKNVILEDNQKKYYVGKLIFDTKNVNPATYLGFGTWKLWGAGRVPVGVDTTDTKFNTVEKTGGSNSVNIAHTHKVSGNTAGHTLTVDEIPPHAHNIERTGNTGGGGYVSTYVTDRDGDDGYATKNSGGGKAHSHSVSLTSGSAGGTISTVQEYITCYIWKRTA